MLFQLLMAMLGVMGFAVLFSAPPRHWLACGVTGVVAWGIYALLLEFGVNEMLAVVAATFALTLVARVFAVILRAPLTIYLVCGVFPLVPGASIYFAAYYLIMGDYATFGAYGTKTIGTAVAIAIGIVLGGGLPQKWFRLLGDRHIRRIRSKPELEHKRR